MTTKRKPDLTVVIFRRWRDTKDVIALFPDLDEGGFLISSYMHVGQHAAANYGYVIRATTPANITDQDVLDLLAELRSIGYKLAVMTRRAR